MRSASIDPGFRFTAEERLAVVAEFDRITAPPKFEKYLWIFKIFYLLAAATAVAGFFIVRRLPDFPTDEAVISISTAAALVALLGWLPPIFMHGSTSSAMFGQAQAGLILLSRAQRTPLPGSPEEPVFRSRAVAILALWSAPSGMWSGNQFDVDDAARRLGPGLPYVQAIERVLIEERGVRPAFTVTANARQLVRN